jgi:hypothetical protein
MVRKINYPTEFEFPMVHAAFVKDFIHRKQAHPCRYGLAVYETRKKEIPEIHFQFFLFFSFISSAIKFIS